MGKRLGKVLTELKFCTDEQIAEALASQLGIPYIQMEEVNIPPEILKLIPETIVRSHTLLPITKKERSLTVAMADPLDAFIVDEIRYQTNLEVEEAIAPESHIISAIRRYFGAEDVSQALKTIKQRGDAAAEMRSTLMPTESTAFDLMANDEAAVVNFVSHLIRQAIHEKASDIHLEPEEDHLRIRVRIDGVLSELVRVPKANQAEIISRVKIMAEMDISEKRLPQDGRIRAKITDKNVDLRVSAMPVVWGEKIVIRILDKSALNLSLRDVGFEDDLLERFETAVRQPNGMNPGDGILGTMNPGDVIRNFSEQGQSPWPSEILAEKSLLHESVFCSSCT